MARRARRVAMPSVDLACVGASSNAFDASAVYLLAGSRPARECTVEEHVTAMARRAELDAQAQADLLGEVITAVFDGLDLTGAARTSANELLRGELLEAAARWDRGHQQ